MEVENEKDLRSILSSVSLKGEHFRRREEVGNLLARERERQRLKCLRRIKYICFGVAACAVFFMVGVWSLCYNDIVIETEQRQLVVYLPGGSDVVLMPRSNLSYNPLMWYFARDVSLSGTALFTVTEGGTFTVRTRVGNVSTSSAEFKVAQREEEMRVACIEGSVKVETKAGKKEVLNAGQAVHCTPQDISKLPAGLVYLLE